MRTRGRAPERNQDLELDAEPLPSAATQPTARDCGRVARNGTDATIRFRRPVSRPADGILVPARSRHRIERHSLRVELGRKVAEQRRRRGWSQPELAHRLGKPASWVSRLERGIADRGSLPVLHILPGPKGHTTDDIVSPDSPDGRHVQAL